MVTFHVEDEFTNEILIPTCVSLDAAGSDVRQNKPNPISLSNIRLTIMRLDGPFRLAVYLGVFAVGSNNCLAFVVPAAQQRLAVQQKTTVLFGDGGFSDDFLNALRPPNDGVPSPEEREKQEKAEGGSRFKALMEAAKQSENRPRSMRNPFADDPLADVNEVLPGPSSSSPVPPMNPDDMSVEDQARMFREFMAGQQGGGGGGGGAPMPQQSQPARQVRGGVDEMGRKIGRNRDTDTIANTSDLYFAQLKRDSSVRTRAFHRGDMDAADQVFQDAGVKKLSEEYKTNPYLR